jgi:hypothetical protein
MSMTKTAKVMTTQADAESDSRQVNGLVQSGRICNISNISGGRHGLAQQEGISCNVFSGRLRSYNQSTVEGTCVRASLAEGEI